ncbi:MAG: DUF502 domain-containing protein [candidate division WOR-3 bacterium]
MAGRFWIKTRRRFLAGVAVMLPVITTFVIIWLFINFIAGWSVDLLRLLPFLRFVPGPILLLLGLLIILFLIYIVGAIATSYIGRSLVRAAENIMSKPPVIKSIYSASRQVVDAVLTGKKPAFRSVVLVQFPYRGTWAIGFITSPEPWVIDGKEHLNIYVPTAPNPTSGWYMIVPKDEVRPVDLTVEEGLKMVISAGLVKEEGGFPRINGGDEDVWQEDKGD